MASTEWCVQKRNDEGEVMKEIVPITPSSSSVSTVPLWLKVVMNHRAAMDTEMARGILPPLNPTLELA
jgi:hypothetical protein